MYNEIDLHLMDSKTAIKIFKKKYNEALKKRDKREICIIHGYGSGKLDFDAILSRTLRDFLAKNKNKLEYRLSLNPGVTYVRPRTRLD